jgi:hypothetical protein
MRSLADECSELLAQPDDILLGEGLLRVAAVRMRAESELRSEGWVRRLSLSSVGGSASGAPLFVGFAPYFVEPPAELPNGSASPVPAQASGEAGLEILRAELGPLLRRELALAPHRVTGTLDGIRRAASLHDRRDLARHLQAMLLSS